MTITDPVRHRCVRSLWLQMALTGVMALFLAATAIAQQTLPGLDLRGTQTDIGPPRSKAPAPSTLVVPSLTVPPKAVTDAPLAGNAALQLTLSAVLTDDGQRIDKGVVWYVFQEIANAQGPGRGLSLLNTLRDPSPTIKLPAADYMILATLGHAHVARRFSLKSGRAPSNEQFVLNAGGLRLTALSHKGEQISPSVVVYDIFSDERDQSGNRSKIAGPLRPGTVVRLNSGIYHVVSTFGDANAQVRADVTVEAGKLTEASFQHDSGRVTFKLVNRAGGEALPDTQWQISTYTGGITVKESVGAFPTHTLAPGNYSAVAKSGGKSWRRDFSLSAGDVVEVEIVTQ